MTVTLSLIGGAGWQFFDDNGVPLAGGKIYTYFAGTTTPQTTYTSRAGDTPNTNPIILDAAGRTPEQIWSTEGLLYKYVIKDANNVLIRTWDNIGGTVVASDLGADLANTTVNSKGDALVGFRQSNASGFVPNAVARTVNDKLQEILSVWDFGADPTGVTDSTAAIQAAIDYSGAAGPAIYIPAGTYLITSSLTITSQRRIFGDGNRRSILRLNTSSTATYAVNILLPNNVAAVGMDIGYFGIICDAGSARGSGISINTGIVNSAISQSAFHDIYITNCTRGVFVDGVVYMCSFRGITVSGSAPVTEYGWYIPNTVRSQVLYNTFENLEVTAVGNSGYAYYSKASACMYRNLTADGCCFFDAFYSSIDGLSIETIWAATAASNYALWVENLSSIRDIALIGIDNAKCGYGISAQGGNFTLSNITVDAQANRPDRILQLYAGNRGTISNIQLVGGAPTIPIQDYTPQSTLNGFVFTNCQPITDRSLDYQTGSWAPGYATWSTAPSTINAFYTKIGRQVFVQLFAQNGVAPAASSITGLPFTSNALISTPVVFSSTTASNSGFARIGINSAEISGFPARTLTGDFWQLSATYIV